MKFLYEPVSRKARAAQYRIAGEECIRRGFPVVGQVNLEMADLLDPPVRATRPSRPAVDHASNLEAEQAAFQRSIANATTGLAAIKPINRAQRGGDPSREGGRRDGAPLARPHHRPGGRPTHYRQGVARGAA